MPTIAQVIEVIEDFARPAWQESYDNTGWQTMLPGQLSDECSGVLLCIDATPEIIDEAVSKGCNLIITHHPLLFRATKRLTGADRVELTTIAALRSGIAIYSSHTALDSAPGGISWNLAHKLGMSEIKTLDHSSDEPGRGEIGLGVTGRLQEPVSPHEFINRVKQVCQVKYVRCSGIPCDGRKISRVAICGGAGGEYIPVAASMGADVIITADIKHNQFLDHSHAIMTIDAGHYETESCAKEIFYDLIHKKFPKFALYYSETEKNPITYL
ncbi:MAG: Nif3-like dinuclear metal center hexameric protein [Muribaculaceae bacterium]|nr:Nif3-like dinuclear metal center hexameric protein [Muribaculaceae bacterium]